VTRSRLGFVTALTRGVGEGITLLTRGVRGVRGVCEVVAWGVGEGITLLTRGVRGVCGVGELVPVVCVARRAVRRVAR